MKYYDLYRYNVDGDLFIVNQEKTQRKWITVDGLLIDSPVEDKVSFPIYEDDHVFIESSLVQRNVPENRLSVLAEYL